MQNISITSHSDAPGDTPATSCAGCGMLLDTSEVYCCAECVDSWAETDPNGLMGVEDDQAKK